MGRYPHSLRSVLKEVSKYRSGSIYLRCKTGVCHRKEEGLNGGCLGNLDSRGSGSSARQKHKLMFARPDLCFLIPLLVDFAL